jgi:hypothetical protein
MVMNGRPEREAISRRLALPSDRLRTQRTAASSLEPPPTER